MKKLFVLVFMALLSMNVSASEFCDGFEQGYITGYKQSSGYTLAPLMPLCPIQPLKKLNDPESDYEQGYLVGLSQGYAAGR